MSALHRLLIVVATHRLLFAKSLTHSIVLFTTLAVTECLAHVLATATVMRVEMVPYTPHSFVWYFVSCVGYTLLMAVHARGFILPLLLDISLSCSDCLHAITGQVMGIGRYLATCSVSE